MQDTEERTARRLPKELVDQLKRLPKNRHGRRAFAVIARRFLARVQSNRIKYDVKKENRIEARLTPRDRIREQHRLNALEQAP